MTVRLRVAVVGLADGPEAEAGAGVIACLDPGRYERVGVVADPIESGAARPELCDRVLTLPPVEDARFILSLVEATRREEVDVVLPGSARSAAALAEGQEMLESAGVRTAPLSRRALELGGREAWPVTARRAGVAVARRSVVTDADLLAAVAAREHWPLLLTGEHCTRLRVNDCWEAVRANEALSSAGGSVTLCDLYPERIYEVALVIDEDAKPIAGSAVRFLADDERLRPWMAVTIENRQLLDTALRLARALGLAGPSRFLFQRVSGAFQMIDACAGFPLWIEVVLAGGPNLVALAVDLAWSPKTASPDGLPCTPAGVLFSQTAEDHVVEFAQAREHD